jgi:hypothetical protein
VEGWKREGREQHASTVLQSQTSHRRQLATEERNRTVHTRFRNKTQHILHSSVLHGSMLYKPVLRVEKTSEYEGPSCSDDAVLSERVGGGAEVPGGLRRTGAGAA